MAEEVRQTGQKHHSSLHIGGENKLKAVLLSQLGVLGITLIVLENAISAIPQAPDEEALADLVQPLEKVLQSLPQPVSLEEESADLAFEERKYRISHRLRALREQLSESECGNKREELQKAFVHEQQVLVRERVKLEGAGADDPEIQDRLKEIDSHLEANRIRQAHELAELEQEQRETEEAKKSIIRAVLSNDSVEAHRRETRVNKWVSGLRNELMQLLLSKPPEQTIPPKLFGFFNSLQENKRYLNKEQKAWLRIKLWDVFREHNDAYFPIRIQQLVRSCKGYFGSERTKCFYTEEGKIAFLEEATQTFAFLGKVIDRNSDRDYSFTPEDIGQLRDSIRHCLIALGTREKVIDDALRKYEEHKGRQREKERDPDAGVKSLLGVIQRQNKGDGRRWMKRRKR